MTIETLVGDNTKSITLPSAIYTHPAGSGGIVSTAPGYPNPPTGLTPGSCAVNTFTSPYIENLQPLLITYDQEVTPFPLEYSISLNGATACKGVVDKHGNFVGQITYRYVSEINMVGFDYGFTERIFTYQPEIFLPHGGDATTLFGMSGTTKSISGELLPPSDSTRKVFLIN
jgi:hypothetical protein